VNWTAKIAWIWSNPMVEKQLGQQAWVRFFDKISVTGVHAMQSALCNAMSIDFLFWAIERLSPD